MFKMKYWKHIALSAILICIDYFSNFNQFIDIEKGQSLRKDGTIFRISELMTILKYTDHISPNDRIWCVCHVKHISCLIFVLMRQEIQWVDILWYNYTSINRRLVCTKWNNVCFLLLSIIIMWFVNVKGEGCTHHFWISSCIKTETVTPNKVSTLIQRFASHHHEESITSKRWIKMLIPVFHENTRSVVPAIRTELNFLQCKPILLHVYQF